jgi:hypothetical protein
MFGYSLELFSMYSLFSTWMGSLPHFHHQSSGFLISYVTDTVLTIGIPSSPIVTSKTRGMHPDCFNTCKVPVSAHVTWVQDNAFALCKTNGNRT